MRTSSKPIFSDVLNDLFIAFLLKNRICLSFDAVIWSFRTILLKRKVLFLKM
ncbi:hypothetical protein CLOSTMETH_00924 [[Clostridium] methylpentosum DSM 5476]|uniref:Uncharacterized protein n=1 Tax=[Clostridium] methylpentosum DSM 5476 TaxID=537013 RepID=C0EAR0_9FIRM|nr:hypothetical protein CLOSTMETH_00924 [[Clostridium] methylpentosum DSM 5476]